MLHCVAMPVQDSLGCCRPPYQRLLRAVFFLAAFAAASRSYAQNSSANYQADVAVIVDTSTSMKQPGMDPERASLLVTKMLVDLVPGKLAVIRLLDLGFDSDILPSVPTGQKEPCDEDPTKIC